MSELTIRNDILSASFHLKGAELCSLKTNVDNVEYIWQADPEYWNRHAPVLFPFVGKLKDEYFEFEEKQYVMGQHGFARDKNFKITEHQGNTISFKLESSEETLQLFPFPFTLTIQYILKGNSLQTRYEVFNQGSKTLYFSIGAHPAFNCPLDDHYEREDHFIQFEQKESTTINYLTNGLLDKEKVSFLGDRLRLTQEVFDRDALIFKSLKSQKVALYNPENKILEVSFNGFPFLGLWSKNRQSPFVCIEPWYGIADSNDHDHNIRKKEGILEIRPQHTFESAYSIEIS